MPYAVPDSSTRMTNRPSVLLLLLFLCLSSLAGTTSLNEDHPTVDIQEHELSEDADDDVFASDESAIGRSNTNDIFQRALQKAIGGGITGAIAGIVQVLGLMWLVGSIVLSCCDEQTT